MEKIFSFDLVGIITSVGYLGIFATMFAEAGLLIGVFLPGDSLLFAAGLLASRGIFNLWLLMIGCWLFAVIGDNVGYSFGRQLGPKIFSREDSWLFHQEHLRRTERFYAKYGPKVLFFAKFIPVIRCLAPIMAGVGRMPYRTFFLFDFLGATFWSFSLLGLGYYLGSTIQDIDRYLLPIIFLVVILSIVPSALEFWRSRRKKTAS